MSANAHRRSLKVLKWLAISGLTTILLLLTLPLAFPKQKWGLINRMWLYLSKYRSLAPYIIAQSKVETANCTSHVYEVNNNLFGMKVPNKRPFLGRPGSAAPASEQGNPYAAYRSDTQSLRDYLVYLDYVNFPTQVTGLYEFADQMKRRAYYGVDTNKYFEAMKFYYA